MRALAQALGTNRLWDEISDTDTLNVGNIAPLSGRLTLGGSATQPDVYIANGHDFQVWGAGAQFRVDGGADALIGGSGSFQVAAVGAHRIFGGTLSLEVPTTVNVPSASGPKLAVEASGTEPVDTLLFQIRDSLSNNLFSIDTEGDVTFTGNLYAPGSDVGTLVQPLGTGYFTTINAGAIIGPVSSDGTTFNTWTVNTDASTGTAENVGVMWESSDGIGSIHNWRELTTTSGREFHLQYKANPTDPKDINEGGYTDLWSCDGVANLMDVYGHLRVGNGVELTARNLLLPATSDSANGVVELGGNPFLHNYNLNTYLGSNAGEFTTASTNLVGVGRDVFSSLTGISSRSVAVGDYALANTTASSFNVAVGYFALNANLIGVRNTAVGEATARLQTAVNDVVAVGYRTLNALNEADGIVAVGSEALTANTTGDANVAVGYRSAYSTTIGRYNVSVGHEALYSNVQGHDNIAVGYHAMYSSASSRDCTAVGVDSLLLHTGGDQNVGFGSDTLKNNLTGVRNTAIGYGAGANATGSYNVFLGWSAGANEAGNNKLYIANSTTTTPLIYGDFTSSELTVNADLLRTSAEPFVINYDADGGTGEVAGHVVAAGDGLGNVEAWRTRLIGPTTMLRFEYKTNPTDLTDLTEVGYTTFMSLNPAGPFVGFDVDVIATGHDFGTAANRLGTVYCTTLDATNIVGNLSACGTSCNVWEVNNDAAGGVAEDTGIALPAGDGANVQNFQFFNNSIAPEVILRYKQNPTDPADLAEAGYAPLITFATTRIVASINFDANLGLDVSGGALTVDASGIDCAGNIELNDTLSFDAAGNIDTSGNNDLTINTGSGNYIVTSGNWSVAANGNVTTSGTEYDFTTNGIVEAQSGRLVLRASTFVQGDAPLVDLRTSVTALDVPSGTGFRIGGTALTTVLWTATGVDTILGGPTSNADAYHTHSTIIGDGTNANIWAINEDAAAVTVEDSALILEAGNGSNLENWQVINDSSAKELVFQYKEDPTDPKDLTEGGYTVLMKFDGASPQAQFPEEVLTENGLVVTNVGVTITGLNVASLGNYGATAYFNRFDMPDTTSSSVGVVSFGEVPAFHTYGSNNTFVGRNAGNFTLTSGSNTAVGENAATALIGGAANVAVGADALVGSTNTTETVAIGYHSISLAVATTRCVAVGWQALRNGNSVDSVAIGHRSLESAAGGANNVGLGRSSAVNLSTGNRNIAIGTRAYYSGQSGDDNIAIGSNSLGDLGMALTGDENVCIGSGTGFSLTGGAHGNVFLGHNAGYNETGSNKLYVANSNSATPLIYGDFNAPSLTINGNFDVNGTTVDLQTNVTTLDVPDGTGFSIGGTALTTANWTAPNVDTLLDGSNADALHVHSAASIATNTANFDGILSAADTTVQAALETIDEVRHIGAAAPAAPYDGQFWYDNSSGERILYVYDGSRSKWLSSSEFTLGWGVDSGDGELLRGFGITVPQTGTGVLVPKDATIVRITCRQVSGPNPKRFDILVNGASAFNWNTAADVYKNNTANIDLNEDDNVWIEVDSAGIGSQDVAVVLWLAWRG